MYEAIILSSNINLYKVISIDLPICSLTLIYIVLIYMYKPSNHAPCVVGSIGIDKTLYATHDIFQHMSSRL